LIERHDDAGWSGYRFQVPKPYRAHLASKGSIAVDGVSLTLVDVTRDRFSVALIPHTLQATTLGAKQVGEGVNLETDLIGKYVAKWMEYLKK
jgi:riboflavin synthase